MSFLHPTTLTKESFSPFGELITLEESEHFAINQGTTERYHLLSEVDVSEQSGKAIISLFRGQSFSLPFQLKVMERHPLGSQSFLPVTQNDDHSYLVVVAPSFCKTEDDIVNNLCAFVAKGFTGVTYAKGVWHHPLISLDRVSDFIVIDRKGPGNNCDVINLTQKITVKF